MSRATCVVRFPDGEMRVAVFDATLDLVRSRLYTVGEWEAWWRATEDWLAPEWPAPDWGAGRVDDMVQVDLAVNVCGCEETWRGFASKEQVGAESRDPECGPFEDKPEGGLPDWWPFPIEAWDREGWSG